MALTKRSNPVALGPCESERTLMSTQPKKTRLKGTSTKKPCFDCGRTRDRFAHFKPRWAGCVSHRIANGRRFYQAGCADCEKLVNGNIRQPRCIDCDKKRGKKQKPGVSTPTPIIAAPKPAAQPVAAAVVEPESVVVEAPTEAPTETLVVEEPTPEAEAEAEPVVIEPTPEVEAEPEAEEAQGETEVLAVEEPSAESVTLPEPTPAPTPKTKARPAIASMADLSKLFGGDNDAE